MLNSSSSSSFQPDSQKSFTEQLGDTIKGTYDSFASSAQPEVNS